jgi:hypothetical protein
MALPTTKVTPTWGQIVKSPPTYMMVVAVSFMWFFAYIAKDSASDKYAASQAEVARLNAKIAIMDDDKRQLDKKNYELLMSLLVNRTALEQIKNTQSKDSLQTAKGITK